MLILQDNVRTNQNTMCDIILLSLKDPYMPPQVWRLKRSQYYTLSFNRTSHVRRIKHIFDSLQSFLHWQTPVYPSHIGKNSKGIFFRPFGWNGSYRLTVQSLDLCCLGSNPIYTNVNTCVNLYMFLTFSKPVFLICEQR